MLTAAPSLAFCVSWRLVVTRDYGRKACYRAEREALPSTYALRDDEVRRWVKAIHDVFWNTYDVRRRVLPRLQFSKRNGGATAYSGAWLINFTSGETSFYTVVHEMAHLYAPASCMHGAAWRRIFVDLLRNMVGSADADRLADSFARHGLSLDHDGPAKRAPRTLVQFRFVDPLGDRSNLLSSWTVATKQNFPFGLRGIDRVRRAIPHDRRPVMLTEGWSRTARLLVRRCLI